MVKNFLVVSRQKLVFLFTALLMYTPFSGHADIAQGYSWLITQQQTDGRVDSTPSLAHPLQATVEAVVAFDADSNATGLNRDQALAFVQTNTEFNTEFISRAILLGIETDMEGESLLGRLLMHQNEDGGFGSFLGYQSTPFDTTFALVALARTNQIVSTSTNRAVSFLITSQNVDGSWPFGLNQSQATITAYCLRALWFYRNIYAVNDALDSAQNYLLSLRDSNGLWTSQELTALALTSIIPRLTETAEVQQSIDQLLSQQETNMSWSSDAYLTGLILQALTASVQPISNPDLGSIRGRLINADTNEPVAGLPLSLTGVQDLNTVTASDGQFEFSPLEVGNYLLQFSAAGFSNFTSPINLQQGSRIDVGDIGLVALSDATTALIRGVVTNSNNGNPLSNVTINANGQSAITNSDGEYEISNVTPGSITLTASHSGGFASVTATAEVTAGSIIVFSPSMVSSFSGPRISGTVRDAVTGSLINSFTVTLTGANEFSSTAFGNNYFLSNLNVGTTRIEIQADGYEAVFAEIDMEPGASYDFSPDLYVLGSTTTILQGQVFNGETGDPQSGIVVELSGANSTSTVTSGSGYFKFDALLSGETVITLSGINFETVSFTQQLNEGDNFYLNFDINPAGFEPLGVEVSGRVIVAGSDFPVVGAVIEATLGDKIIVAVADIAGNFALNGITTEGLWELRAYRTNYAAKETEFYMPDPVISLDVGTIEMKESVKLPDLEVKTVSRRNVSSDVNNFFTSGTLNVSIFNRGISDVTKDFDVIAYFDADMNDTYNEQQDVLLGVYRVETDILIGEEASIELPISGQLPFRDAAIRVKVDTQSEILELLKDNNELGTCEVPGCGG